MAIETSIAFSYRLLQEFFLVRCDMLFTGEWNSMTLHTKNVKEADVIESFVTSACRLAAFQIFSASM